jgi:hypothetical protein
MEMIIRAKELVTENWYGRMKTRIYLKELF